MVNERGDHINKIVQYIHNLEYLQLWSNVHKRKEAVLSGQPLCLSLKSVINF